MFGCVMGGCIVCACVCVCVWMNVILHATIEYLSEWDSSAANMLHSYCMLALKCVHFSLKDGSQVGN